MFGSKIPEFIKRDVLKDFLSITGIQRDVFTLREYSLGHFIKRQKDSGFCFLSTKTIRKGRSATVYSVKQVLFRAIATGHTICFPDSMRVEKCLQNIDMLNDDAESLKLEIANLQLKKSVLVSDLSKIEFDLNVYTIVRSHLMLPFCSIVQIRDAKRKWEPLVGVYFLFKEDEVVYVGQSINVAARIATHSTEKDFDSFSVVACLQSQLNFLEALYIRLLEPKLNISSRGYLVHPAMDLTNVPQLALALNTIGQQT